MPRKPPKGPKARKNIAELIEELKSWLPNYDHGPTDYPTILYRVLAAAPGGEELEDMGYEPIGNLGWHELDQLGRVLVAIQDKQDVEELIAGLREEEEEDLREPLREAPRRLASPPPPSRAPMSPMVRRRRPPSRSARPSSSGALVMPPPSGGSRGRRARRRGR